MHEEDPEATVEAKRSIMIVKAREMFRDSDADGSGELDIEVISITLCRRACRVHAYSSGMCDGYIVPDSRSCMLFFGNCIGRKALRGA